MPPKPRWTESKILDGVAEIQLSSWRYLHEYINQEMLDFREYIWRGQRRDDWVLQPTLDRRLSQLSKRRADIVRKSQLDNFKYAARGRRGPNPSKLTENEWWALGQHHGLDTPLLDWTTSPFAATYFAFSGKGSQQTKRRAIYAVFPPTIKRKGREIKKGHSGDGRPPIVELVRPLSDDNPRLVNQSGLFTRAPDGIDLETWITEHFEGVDDECILIKITILNSDRALILRSLNRMNINHLTLFPDLYGASRFCNLDIEIDQY